MDSYNAYMSIYDNYMRINEIEDLVDKRIPVKLGVNKRNEIIRLVYEISMTDGGFPSQIINDAMPEVVTDDIKGELFHYIKRKLSELRYPSAGKKLKPRIMPVKIDLSHEEAKKWDSVLLPKKIFIEKEAEHYKLTKTFIEKFQNVPVEVVENIAEVVKRFKGVDPVTLFNQRRDYIFLVKSRASFVKPCPCTKGYKRCGYWILNAGFGCPYDCAYCYLQMYSNAPGLVLPVNVDDYFEQIIAFDKKVNKRTRIGTGEFTDSLALDNYTEFSTEVLSFFEKTNNLVFELKTKSVNIDNIIDKESSGNIVLSWSVNPQKVIDKYEIGAESLEKRIDAAQRASDKGYMVGFHFDPIIFYPGWEEDYEEVVNAIFSDNNLVKKTEWISLGTLRYTPGFKQFVEQRFEDNLMFYQGEFCIDTDGKFRYPREQRVSAYNKMIKWIRTLNNKSWIYLCMEPEELWKKTILEPRDYSYN